MAAPQLLVFAGPNGSGKSSITQTIPVTGVYINADKIQEELRCDALTAAQSAAAARNYCIQQRMSFTMETVLSSPFSFDVIQSAFQAGYEITLIYVLTNDPHINAARVASRIAAGGNFVAEEKIIPRYWKSLALLPQVIPLCQRVLIFDNSAERNECGPDLIVSIRNDQTAIFPNAFWSEESIRSLLAGTYHPPET